MCPQCRQPLTACQCAAQAAAAALARSDGVVRVGRETKGRGGKAVTLVRGLPVEPQALQAQGKQLRTLCGSGGTVKDGVIEIQGDHVERVIEALRAGGWTVKRTGG